MNLPAMNWLNLTGIKKALPLFAVYFLASVIAVVIGMGGLLPQRIGISQLPAKASAGYSPFISASNYGAPGAGVATQTGGQLDVQNIQPPTISGFSSDLFTGGATVSYPLDLPPGRGGLTPSLSLNYSSHSVYGPVMGMDVNDTGKHDQCDIIPCSGGYENWTDQLIVQSSQIGLGWDIGGLGYVFRDATKRYTLVLNGQSYRLFKSPTEDNWDGETWHTDPESFLKIRHQVIVNDEPGGEGSPVDKFIIYDTNGTYYEFTPRGFFWKRCDLRRNGACYTTENSTEAWAASWNKWVLNRVRDVHGNEIDFAYTEERQEVNPSAYLNSTYPRAVYPHMISYSGTYAGGFQAKVEFVFADREDWKNLRGAGIQTFFSTKRIGRIDIRVKQGANWKIVRQYGLDNGQYFTGKDNKNLHPELTKIIARGRDGAEALPPHTFDYYNDPQDYNITNHRLLKVADNGYGGKVTYGYQSYNANDFLPKTGDSIGTVYGNHRVTEKIAEDGRGNSFKTSYDYPLNPTGVGISDDNKHSGFELVGHSQVVEKVYKKNSNDVLRTTVYDFNQGKYFPRPPIPIPSDPNEPCYNKFFVKPERGRVSSVKVYDGGMGTLLSTSESDYLREKSDGTDDRVATCADYRTKQDTIWNTAHFIAAKESRSCQDPTSPQSLGSKATYEYDKDDQGGQQWGNLTQATTYKIAGDCNSATNLPGATAYRATHNTYFPNETSHITNRVAESETFACNTDPSTGDCIKTKRLALSWNLYDDKGGNNPKQTPGIKGLLTLTRAFYTFPEPVGAATGARPTVDTKFAYNGFGNLTTTTTYDAYGQSSSATPGGGTARTSVIEYEDTYNTFPIRATTLADHPTLERSTSTEYRRGTTVVNHPYLADRTITTDINSQPWTTVVDGFGRTTKTLVPGEGDTPQTIVEYNDDDDTNNNGILDITESGAPLVVHTQSRDDKDDDPNNITYHHAWQFYNGLGQVIESQSELEGNTARITVAASDYNALGQAVKTLLPYESSGGGNLVFQQPNAANNDWTKTHSEADYDALGRVTKSIAPGNRVTETGYYGRKTAVLDPNKHLATTEVDNLGRTSNARVFNGNRSLGTPDDYYAETKFQYDHLDRLLTTTDTLGYVSTVTYNQFGQKISSDDPDLGLWNYTYYPTGTLWAVQDAKFQVKSFDYDDLDRVVRKYVNSAWQADGTTVVHGPLAASFDYDGCANGKGRLCTDSTHNQAINASTAYGYDQKGRLQSEMKTIDGTPYTTTFAYDAAGRQREITYPDGEKVAYAYNDAGLLANVAGAQTYMASAKYNALGQPEEEVLGNQTKNIYTYEPQTYRLDTKTVRNKSGTTDLWSQNLDYDPVGNITSITYPLRKPSSFPQLPFKIDYTYDDLNRLTGGKLAGLTDEAAREVFYTDYEYDQLGRMTSKIEEGETEQCNNKEIVYNIDANTILAVSVPSKEKTWITFDFYNNNGKEIVFVGDWAEYCQDTGEGDDCYPYTVFVSTDVIIRYTGDLPANYEGYVVVESHQQGDYPGSADGPCVEVTSGSVDEICPNCPQAFLTADLDCDCDVDIMDIMKVASIWNTETGDEDFNPHYDFDGSGSISVMDIMYEAAKWDTECGK